jgi:hypothetical protein
VSTPAATAQHNYFHRPKSALRGSDYLLFLCHEKSPKSLPKYRFDIDRRLCHELYYGKDLEGSSAMNARQQRGLAIADTSKITCKGSTWFVSSQSSGGNYAVRMTENPTCTCPDYELREMKCKHIFAVEITRKRYMDRDGSITTTQTVSVTETIKKPTYKQVWPAYNAAQTNEKDKFQVLLGDLCRGIIDETPRTKGQPRLPLADAIFSAVFKVYSTVSGRRFSSDLREAEQRGHIAKPLTTTPSSTTWRTHRSNRSCVHSSSNQACLSSPWKWTSLAIRPGS